MFTKAAPPPPPLRGGTDQVRAILSQSWLAAMRNVCQLMLDHAHDLLQLTTTRAKDTCTMAETIVANAVDLHTDVLDLANN
ncbi:hypothetical protein AMAG_20715 [Allomyces macrogynus ATCC 38327]|uniref:Uncharacterized protein n=1 Tax=Allomyces macrogynus (strain ATCC 38327) TaxID=578462 RepID=A0A0L0TEZ1_ALLM3|nr:hypothetical protein AMAG_20715 [Allomyces macrogynus ATCC 38327]|eukprot:KNE73226.1 hypothetical protein AMAG_20715 [Allomyces macrogynus ATCC 38327]